MSNTPVKNIVLFLGLFWGLFFMVLLTSVAPASGIPASGVPATEIPAEVTKSPASIELNSSHFIDLAALTWHAKQGFDSSDRKGFKPGGTAKKITEFPVYLNTLFPVSPGSGIEHFTLQTDFEAGKWLVESELIPGIYLSMIGENWEVYLNGHLLRKEIYLTKEDDPRKKPVITLYKVTPEVVIPFEKNILKEGNNRLVFHFVGNAPPIDRFRYTPLGFPRSFGYYIDDLETLKREQAEFIKMQIKGIFILFGLCFMFFYIKKPEKKASLYLSFLSFFIAFRFVFSGNYIHHLVANSSDIQAFEYLLTVLIIPFMLLFLHYLLYPEKKLGVTAKLFICINLFFAFAVAVIPVQFIELVLVGWLACAVPGLVYIFFFVLREVYRKKPGAWLISIALVIPLVAAIWDFTDIMYLNTGVQLLEIGFLIMLLSFGVNSVSIFLKMHDKTVVLNLELTEQKDAFFRFVPVNFLRLLGKESAVDIALGNSGLRRMSLIFSDIRSFTSLSEKMTPEDNVAFLNSYLKRLEPTISKYGGFVDKYMGDAIFALFAEPEETGTTKSSADMALCAALEMRQALGDYNEHRLARGYDPVNAGIGVNTGDLMLGMVGSETRIDTTVIGDTVNLAARLESLTAIYELPIIISDHTYRHLTSPEKHHIRGIDSVFVKGKNEPVMIYEVYDLDDSKTRAIKKQTEADFQVAIAHYKTRQFEKALKVFKEINVIDPDDTVIDIYIQRSTEYIKNPPPEDWDGITRLDKK
ncbi:MAG: adenylate/guanylate cyclase domain-containing protein [bacterium]|nr:adenylate/guanylate cyclase domain-containing protein [bacterium]